MDNFKAEDLRILNELYKNAEMGINAINTLIEKADDDNLKKELSTQLHKFRSVEADIEREMESRGVSPEPNSAVGKLGLRASVKMNLMMSAKPTHIAQMMIEGAGMGIIDLSRAINSAQTHDARIHSLADKLLQTEENSAKAMRAYL